MRLGRLIAALGLVQHGNIPLLNADCHFLMHDFFPDCREPFRQFSLIGLDQRLQQNAVVSVHNNKLRTRLPRMLVNTIVIPNGVVRNLTRAVLRNSRYAGSGHDEAMLC